MVLKLLPESIPRRPPATLGPNESADFHHVTTSVQEGCDFFVTTDEKHLLRSEYKKHFEKHIRIANPDEALEVL